MLVSVGTLTSIILGLSDALPQAIHPRNGLPVANYTCSAGGFLPQQGCYPELYRGSPQILQAWGVYLDNGAQTYLTPAAAANLALTCATPLNSLCAFINANIDDPNIRNDWIWSISPGPGCLAAVFIPGTSVPEPAYAACHQHIDVPMREVLADGVATGMNRASVNLNSFPSLPDTYSLTTTITKGPLKIPVAIPGGSVNGSLSSWLIQA